MCDSSVCYMEYIVKDGYQRVRDVKLGVTDAITKVVGDTVKYLGFRFDCQDVIKTYYDMDPSEFIKVASIEQWVPDENNEADRELVKKIQLAPETGDNIRYLLGILENAVRCNNEILIRTCVKVPAVAKYISNRENTYGKVTASWKLLVSKYAD